MATVAPPPAKRQRREATERTKTQQDVTAILPPDNGSFKARFLDGDGKQMADVIEVPLADASEKNLSLLLNTLLARVCRLMCTRWALLTCLGKRGISPISIPNSHPRYRYHRG